VTKDTGGNTRSDCMHDRVRGPAISLIVLGVVGAVAYLASFAVDPIVAALLQALERPEREVRQSVQFLHPFGWGFDIAQIVVGLIGSAFIIYAGVQMKNLRKHTLAMVASVLVMVPFCSSCCCIIGIPIGIWSLVVLSKSEVKEAFTS
jgi:hypothetical protein